jgi:hypothetical protein
MAMQLCAAATSLAKAVRPPDKIRIPLFLTQNTACKKTAEAVFYSGNVTAEITSWL